MFGFEVWDESIIILSTFIKLEIIALDLYECVCWVTALYAVDEDDTINLCIPVRVTIYIYLDLPYLNPYMRQPNTKGIRLRGRETVWDVWVNISTVQRPFISISVLWNWNVWDGEERKALPTITATVRRINKTGQEWR